MRVWLETLKDLSDALRAIRKSRNLTQAQLAVQLGFATSQVSDLEQGHDPPTAYTVGKYTDYYGVDGATRDLWFAWAGHVEPKLLGLLVSNPQHWEEVRELLRKRLLK